jgi:transcriptional regulator with XRE-family HTH domain
MPPKTQVSPLRQKLGVELRKLREDAGMTADDAAARLEISSSTISRSETGFVQPHPRDVDAMCQLYGHDEGGSSKRQALVALARKSRERGWWYKHRKDMSDELLSYVAIESGAATISSYQNMILPGALQTPDYSMVLAETLIHPDVGMHVQREVIDQQIEIRTERQKELFTAAKHTVTVVLDEQVLTRPIATPKVMRAQLELLLQIAELDGVNLQIVPFAAGAYAGLGGSFTLFGFAPPIELDIVHVENHGRNYMVENEDIIRYYEIVFHRVQDSALPVSESRSRVKEIAEGL